MREYYRELEVLLGLEQARRSAEKVYTTLMSIEQAVEGPGRDAMDIQAIAELRHGIYNFCGN